jgi:nitrogenase iron protein NifH
MEKIAIYGKGGIGKSFIATSLSVSYAMSGRKVLHVGCDPKHDSAIRLIDGQVEVRTVLDVLGDDPTANATAQILNRGRHGIDACEAGGPEAGLGCGGRGVARMIEYLDETRLLETGGYDVAIFDVLGDVVCGGFAAPLREGFARKVLIVVTDQPMALFAANNISRAVLAYQRNHVVLAGLVLNQVDTGTDRGIIDRFAARIGTRTLASLQHDTRIMDGERQQRTIVEHAPDSVPARAIAELGNTVMAIRPDDVPLPTPMTDQEFFAFLREGNG